MNPNNQKNIELANIAIVLIACAVAVWYFFSQSTPKTWRPPGLVAAWSGDDTNNLVMVNVNFTNGVVGRAFTFAPNSFSYGTYVGVQIADRPEFMLTNSLTIEGWIRPRGDGYVILCRGDHRPGLDPYTLSMQAGHDLRFEICNADNVPAFLDATLPYGQWTHVAATLDGNTGSLCIYTNGELVAQSHTDIRPLGDLLPDQWPGLGIGNLNQGGVNFPFIGDINEVALYSRALTADEVRTLYLQNAEKAGERAELLPVRN